MSARLPNSVFSPGLVLQQRYQLEEPLAVGGMAEVWQGRDAVLQRPVAVKLLHPHLAADSTIAERFRREAISAAKLSHPHIVPTYDAGTEDGISFIVLGLIQGPTLAQVLRQRKISTREAAAIARQVAGALDHAHRAGLIHRDIKPSNILMVDDEQRVMVADFGIAKAVDSSTDPSLTLPGFVVGTPAYVAPEQAAGSEADVRTDVYAVGVLMHEMCCNHTTVDEPTRLSATTDAGSAAGCPLVPEVLREIIERATAHDPGARFQTAEELCEALEEVERTMFPASPESDPTPTPTSVQAQQSAPSTRTRPEETTPIPPSARALRSESAIRSRRRTIFIFAVVAVLIAAAIAFGRLLSGFGDDNDKTTETTALAPLSITEAKSFDPNGTDKVENDAQTRFVFDGQATTAWNTETYASRTFGNLKPGVGLILKTDRASKLRSLSVETASQGWNAQIHVANGNQPATLADWGAAVDSKTAIPGNTTFDLHNTEGSYVLIWITDLGSTNRVAIHEARILG